MERLRRLKARLLFSYVFIGLVNLIIILTFVYYESRHSLIERGMNHMISVRSLASQKLNLKLENLKHLAKTNPEELRDNNFVQSHCEFSENHLRLIRGEDCPSQSEIESLPLHYLYPWKNSSFLLKTFNSGMITLWIFSNEVMNSVLLQRAGLGSTGEIYLVGEDYYIKSASRFIKDWQNLKVNNEAVVSSFLGKQDTTLVKDYREIEVISSYSPFQLDGLKFSILSEIDLEEVISPLKETFSLLMALGASLILLTLGMAFLATRGIIGKIKTMQEEIRNLNEQRVNYLSESAQMVIKAQEEERERLAYNLHDSVGQYLTALKWGLSQFILELKDNLPLKIKAREMGQLCENTMLEVRSISTDIMPSLISDFGIFHAIEDFLNNQKKIYDIEIQYRCSEKVNDYNFRKDFQVNLYRMIQELVQNTVKHARADSVTVSFEIAEKELILIYGDDGTGIKDSQTFPRSLSYRALSYKGIMERLEKDGLFYKISFNLRDVTNEDD